MITYEKYAEIRASKGLKDSDVAKRANIPQSTFSDWKKGKSSPKADKMQKIADALEMDYYELIGPVGKFSSYNLRGKEAPDDDKPDPVPDEIIEFYRQYQNLPQNLKDSVDLIIKSQQRKP